MAAISMCDIELEPREHYARLFSEVQVPMEGVLLYCDIRNSICSALTKAWMKEEKFRLKPYWGPERFSQRVVGHYKSVDDEKSTLDVLTSALEDAMSSNYSREARNGTYVLVWNGSLRAGLVVKEHDYSVELMSAPRSITLQMVPRKNVVCDLEPEKLGMVRVGVPAAIEQKGMWAVGFPQFYLYPGNNVQLFKSMEGVGFLGEFEGEYSAESLSPVVRAKPVQMAGPYR